MEHQRLGFKALMYEHYEEAITHFSRVLSEKPDHHVVLFDRSRCFEALGCLQKACSDAQRCATVKPDYGTGLAQLARVNERLGNIGSAMRAYVMAARCPEPDPEWAVQAERLRAELESIPCGGKDVGLTAPTILIPRKNNPQNNKTLC